MTVPYFGRSSTVPTTITGAGVAPAVTRLREVSVTGAEYPGLYCVTGHIVAEMLGRGASEGGSAALPPTIYLPQVTRAPWIVRDEGAESEQETPEPEQRAETAEPWITYRIVERLPHLRKQIELARKRLRSGAQFEEYIGLALTSPRTLIQEDPFVYQDTAVKLLWAGAQVEPEVEAADIYVESEKHGAADRYVESEKYEAADVYVESEKYGAADIYAELKAHGAAEPYVDDPPPPATQSLVDLAEEIGAIPDEVAPPIALSGNLTRDVLALTGFTAAELATVVGRTERSVRQWIADDHVPGSAATLLMQLRTIALRLVGGLGSRGVRAWLLSGEPSPAQLISAGEAPKVLAETDRLLDSPAT